MHTQIKVDSYKIKFETHQYTVSEALSFHPYKLTHIYSICANGLIVKPTSFPPLGLLSWQHGCDTTWLENERETQNA